MRVTFVMIAAFIMGGTAGAAAELPNCDVSAFPGTVHQLSVLRAAQTKRCSPTLELAVDGPASPHQQAVLTPRRLITEQQIDAMLRMDGFSQAQFVIPSEYIVMALRNGAWTKLIIHSRTGEKRGIPIGPGL